MASGPLTVKLQINADGSAAIVGLNKVKGALDATGQEAKAAAGGFKTLSSSLQGLALTAGAALSVGALAQSFITANLESQRLAKGLAAVAGSATAGAAEMAYISQTADRLGLSLTATGSAYVSLTAATKGTALEGDKTRQIFESVSLAMGKLGKSSADTQGALTAIEQMISKGKVSAEELRGQLGERLPGAFKLAAEAMGVTTAELDEMLTKGEVLATDLLPALSQKLNALYDDGQAVGGLEAEWNKLTNALGRMMAAADNASSATSGLGSVLQWATGLAASFATSLNATANARAGLGFQTFADDSSQLVAAMQARAQALDDYVKARKRADEYKDDNNFGPSMEADAAAALKRFQDLSVQANNLRAGLDAAAVAQDALNQKQAAGVGDDMVARWEAHNAAIATNAAELAKLNGKYDASIAKKAEYAKMEAALTEAVKLGTLSEAERTTKLAAFAAAQDKAAASSRSHAKALSAEAQVVAQVEQKYGLMKGQLDAVWQMESSRGKGAGIGTTEWVKDLGRGHGHMTLLVGQFRMAAATAKGLGADMTTFNGQADAAGKYLAEAAAQGKTLWEQFAYYHGGPNEKNWKEQTRAYADAAVKLVATTLGTQRDIGQNTGQVITASLNRSQSAVESLIQRYLPARAAAEAYAQAQIDLATASDLVGLSQEEQSIILQGLQKDLEKSQVTVSDTADAWTEVWKNAVKRIDDTFANLWQDLFSGAKSTLDSLKRAITSWLAEVAHALITKPLVVAITAGMTGGAGTAGATGTVANAASGAGGFGNLLSMGSSLWSGVTSLFSAATYTGLMDGFMAATSIMSSSGILGGASSVAALSSGAASTGSMAFAIGAAAPYLIAALPIAAIAYGIFAKYQKDQKPRYGAYAATTHGGTGQFEDSVGVAGAFGLTFGMNDKGSANIDAEEARAVFEGFAKMSEALAQFYGGDVAAEVEATLKQISNEHYARTGILNYAMDVNAAFDVAFTQIIDAAAATGDSVAVVMKAVVGDLSGTAESMAKQIETAMQTTTAVITVAKALEGTDAGKILELGDDLTANALKLVDYARHAQGAGETIAQALARMSLNLTGLSTALDLSGQTVAATGTAFIDLARDLAATADAAGVGMAGLMQLQAVYFDQFFSDTAKFTRNIEAASKAITAGFKSLNLAVDLSVMKDRQAFIDLVNSIDLTTEAGRKFYVELMKLAPAFDAVFDGVEAFMDWLRPQDKAARAFDDLTDLFDKWGITMPKTREEFDKLVASGILTAEQMAILGGRLDALNLVFSELSQRASLLDFAEVLSPTNGASPDRIKAGEDAFRKAGYKGDLRDPKGMADFVRTIAALPDAGGEAVKELLKYVDTFDQFFDAIAAAAQQHSDLQLRLAEAQGDNALALRLRREQELKDALDDTNRALLKRIYALEDAKAAMNAAYAALERAVAAERQQVEEAYQARVDAINAEREAINAAHEERIAAINAEREALQTQISAAQEALSKIEGILGSVQSALDTIRGQLAVSDIALAAARRQLANWARQGVLPDQEAFDRVMGTLNRDDKGNYASANAYRSNQQATYANLLELERLGLAQKTAAEKQLEALEAQTAALDAQITQADQISQDQLDALDEQLKQADAWRADELERLDLILEDAKKAMEITLGIYEEVIAIDDALKALNKAMADYLALRDLGKSQALDPNLGDAANDPMGSASVAQQAGFDDLRAEIIELRNVIATVGTAQITPLKSIDDRLRKFDTDGLPPGRDDVVLLRAA